VPRVGFPVLQVLGRGMEAAWEGSHGEGEAGGNRLAVTEQAVARLELKDELVGGEKARPPGQAPRSSRRRGRGGTQAQSMPGGN
jgi:hypothetical protein